MEPPTVDDVREAEDRLRPHLKPTPLVPVPALSDLLGCEVSVKLESLLPTGSFKVRGGLNLVSQLSEAEREAGIIAASTGNHGQSLAYAARLLGVPCLIGAPEGANPAKVASMRNLGAEVVLHGPDYDAAREWVEAEAAAQGHRYVHSANEPQLVAGIGTAALEVLRDDPEVDAILVPVGGGSGASAYCTVVKALKPEAEVCGVQSEAAPAFHRSWEERRLVEMPSAGTFAEGLQTRVPFAFTMSILWKLLDDFFLVPDEAIKRAVATYLWTAHLVAEGAAAAPLAAAYLHRDRWEGRRVALVLSGHNIAAEKLRGILSDVSPFGT